MAGTRSWAKTPAAIVCVPSPMAPVVAAGLVTPPPTPYTEMVDPRRAGCVELFRVPSGFTAAAQLSEVKMKVGVCGTTGRFIAWSTVPFFNTTTDVLGHEESSKGTIALICDGPA